MKPLGTILPTGKSIAADNRYYAEQLRKKAKLEKQELAGLEKRIVGMETRFYASETVYALVNHVSLKVLWFETRDDGDYSIPNRK